MKGWLNMERPTNVQNFINELENLMYKYNVYLDTRTDGWIDVCYHEKPYSKIQLYYDKGYSQIRVTSVKSKDEELL